MPLVVLWDIDGTLVRGKGGRVTLTAFLGALQTTSKIAELPYPKDVGGKTDPQIALEMLLAASIGEDIATGFLPAFGDAYFTQLDSDRARLTADLRVLPGVPAILSRLRDLGVCQSVLTGNFESVARLKLTCAGLDEYVAFDLGAYGSDQPDRTRLVPIAQARLRARLGYEVPAADIVIVGDTPRDIAGARAGGANVVAVATGNFSREALEAHHPDVVLDDLQDTSAVVECLRRLSTATVQ